MNNFMIFMKFSLHITAVLIITTTLILEKIYLIEYTIENV